MAEMPWLFFLRRGRTLFCQEVITKILDTSFCIFGAEREMVNGFPKSKQAQKPEKRHEAYLMVGACYVDVCNCFCPQSFHQTFHRLFDECYFKSLQWSAAKCREGAHLLSPNAAHRPQIPCHRVRYLCPLWSPDADTIKFRYIGNCLLYTSPSPRDRTRSRMPSSA